MDSDEQRYVVIGERAEDSDTIEELAYEVLVGLSSEPKRLPSRFFYDDVGSRLFARIMRLEEYYLTDCEHSILERSGPEILSCMEGRAFNLVDLGAGDGAKTMLLLRHLAEIGADVTYVPIDISEGAMKGLVATIRKELPSIRVEGVVAEYHRGLQWLVRQRSDRANLVLFLGSNVGNFDRAQARGFLGRIWASLRSEDRVLVGFDLKKDIEKLLAAYNDREGVTSAFNLNLLERINRELGANFVTDRFRHFGTYDVTSGAMKSYLVSLDPQDVRVDALDRSFHFDAWEPVHTEYSYKYLRSDLDSLAHDSGFVVEQRFEDERGWFADDLWRPRKGGDDG
ncbi:MAG: L-histidine N(alpha)-methyltransferase [Deltaproteobacteria bacterium]|nr:L-histidine N(alpha)-methyltransferase [Deltaproteobacteria bacterium]